MQVTLHRPLEEEREECFFLTSSLIGTGSYGETLAKPPRKFRFADKPEITRSNQVISSRSPIRPDVPVAFDVNVRGISWFGCSVKRLKARHRVGRHAIQPGNSDMPSIASKARAPDQKSGLRRFLHLGCCASTSLLEQSE